MLFKMICFSVNLTLPHSGTVTDYLCKLSNNKDRYSSIIIEQIQGA